MLTLPGTVRIFLCARPVDLRKSFDGLALATRGIIGEDPLCGHVFIFLNRRGDRAKLLLWDRNGYLLVYKRLELGVYRWQYRAGRREARVTWRSRARSWRSCWRGSTCAARGGGRGGRRERPMIVGRARPLPADPRCDQ